MNMLIRKVNAIMKVTVKSIKSFVLALIALPLLTLALMNAEAAPVAAQDADIAAVYKAKCSMCHGAKSEKFFDPAKIDDQLAEVVLKGAKPKMPAYEEKGITADQAKALVALMRQLRQ
jgi:mono/diheme cytochrome c family protein